MLSVAFAVSLMFFCTSGCSRPAPAGTQPIPRPHADKEMTYDPTSLIEVKALSDLPSQVRTLANASFMGTNYDSTPTKFLVGGVSRSNAVIAYEEFGYVTIWWRLPILSSKNENVPLN